MISDEELEVLTEEHVEQNGTGGNVVAQVAPAAKLPAAKPSSVKLPVTTNGRVSKNGAPLRQQNAPNSSANSKAGPYHSYSNQEIRLSSTGKKAKQKRNPIGVPF